MTHGSGSLDPVNKTVVNKFLVVSRSNKSPDAYLARIRLACATIASRSVVEVVLLIKKREKENEHNILCQCEIK